MRLRIESAQCAECGRGGLLQRTQHFGDFGLQDTQAIGLGESAKLQQAEKWRETHPGPRRAGGFGSLADTAVAIAIGIGGAAGIFASRRMVGGVVAGLAEAGAVRAIGPLSRTT